MQEELEQKSVAISIKAGKLTANLLKKAVEKALAEMEKSQKNPKIYKRQAECETPCPAGRRRFQH